MLNQITELKVIGKRVRDRRIELELTQTALARQIGVSASFIGHIERAEKVASFDTMAKLCKALNVSLDWLAWGEVRRCEGRECPLYRELATLFAAYGLERRT